VIFGVDAQEIDPVFEGVGQVAMKKSERADGDG
jgi:hypothetical protein